MPERPGDTQFELHIGNVPHGQEDLGKRILSICTVFSLKFRITPKLYKVCLPIMRSYIGSSLPGSYSTISG